MYQKNRRNITQKSFGVYLPATVIYFTPALVLIINMKIGVVYLLAIVICFTPPPNQI